VRGYDAFETHPVHANGNEPEGHTMGEACKAGNRSDCAKDLAEWASWLAERGAGIREYAGCRSHYTGMSAVGTAADGHQLLGRGESDHCCRRQQSSEDA
jgi:hypothetical protein